jgi:hypothetical protein
MLRAAWLFDTAYMMRSSAVVPELLALHGRAVTTGDLRLRKTAIEDAVDCLLLGTSRDSATALRGLADAHMAAATASADAAMVAWSHYTQACAAVRLAAWGDVERHLPGFDHWRTSDDPWSVYCWHHFTGLFAMERGDFAEAIVGLERTAALADGLGFHGEADWYRGQMRSCEDQQRRASRRKAGSGPRSGSSGRR